MLKLREPWGRAPWLALKIWATVHVPMAHKKALDNYIGWRYSDITADDISSADISGGVTWALRENKRL